MCPLCPHCVESDYPCMDMFGSNGTPMGGAAGGADAMIGAVEAQLAEGALHLHFFTYLQMAFQFKTLEDIAAMLKQELLTGAAWKKFVSHVRCGAYPDPEKFEAERTEIEKAWPAYNKDQSLCRLDEDLWEATSTERVQHPWADSAGSSRDAWLKDGEAWVTRYSRRSQHCLSRMNHHIHPLNAETGERYVLNSCKPKDRKKSDICKHDYPLTHEMTDAPLLVCDCIAKERGLTARGVRGKLGDVLVRRNNEYLNAGPRVWCAFMGDNGDIKFTAKLPILLETHELVGTEEERKACCSARHPMDMLFDLQARQAAQAGYCGGYATKVQPIGAKELDRFHEAFVRKVESMAGHMPKAIQRHFADYTKRFFKDMESKGTMRTVVESMNLAEFADHADPLMAECPRTFPSVNFPAGSFLKREEMEKDCNMEASAIRPMRHAFGNPGQAHVEGPIDLLYGFRGREYEVDLMWQFQFCSKLPKTLMRNDQNKYFLVILMFFALCKF